MHIPSDTKVSVMPRFITFTGADDQTSLYEMLELSSKYPIEWGILFSKDRVGVGRYPSLERIRLVVDTLGVLRGRMAPRLSAHICGAYAKQIATSGKSEIDELVQTGFSRAQINIASAGLDMLQTGTIALWARGMQIAPILQCREDFPQDLRFSWLVDSSGGRGIERKAWPRPSSVWHARSTLKGYAGGLSPVNVQDHVTDIGEHDQCYWCDMESSLRDENDRFDLARCAAVCEAVYGRP